MNLTPMAHVNLTCAIRAGAMAHVRVTCAMPPAPMAHVTLTGIIVLYLGPLQVRISIHTIAKLGSLAYDYATCTRLAYLHS